MTATHALALLAGSALRSLAAALVLGLALVLLRRRWPRLRQQLWRWMLVAALAMPLLCAWLPSATWTLPRHALPAAIPAPIAASVGSGLQAAPWRNGSSTASPALPAQRPFPWPATIFAVYLLGALALLLRMGLGWRLVRRLARLAVLIPEVELQTAAAKLAAETGLRPVPEVRCSPTVSVPLTAGSVRPVVILPEIWRTWSAAERDAVLRHELAHIAHKDAFWLGLSLLHRALYWFSPLAWWLPRELARLGEEAADLAALEAGAEPAAYARLLLAWSARQGAPRRAAWHAVALAGSSRAGHRIERILAWQGPPPPRLPLRTGLLLFAAAAIALAATARVRAAAPPLPPAPAVRLVPAPSTAPPLPPAPAPNLEAGEYDWTRAYVGQPASALLQDTQFNVLLTAIAPDAIYHYHQDMPLRDALALLLRGKPDTVQLRADRYLSFSATASVVQLSRAWIWIDLDRPAAAAAIAFAPAQLPGPNLTIVSRQLSALPAALLQDFDTWATGSHLPQPMATFFLGGDGATTLLPHRLETCRPSRALDSQLCPAVNLDRANADVKAALYLVRHHYSGGNTPTALAEVDAEQAQWQAGQTQACGINLTTNIPCRLRLAEERIRQLQHELTAAQSQPPSLFE